MGTKTGLGQKILPSIERHQNQTGGSVGEYVVWYLQLCIRTAPTVK